MPHYGILRDRKLEGVDDVRGAQVYGVNDEKLGTIDDVIFDHSSGDIRYVVLKTGGLLSRKRVMVPVNRIEPYGQHEDRFYAELDKERLEMLPEFNDESMKSEGDWSRFEKDYEKRWNEGAVMYNKETGRIITPPPEKGAGIISEASSSAGRKLDLTPEKMGKEDDLLGVASGTGKTTLQPKKPSIGGKEDVDMIQRQTQEIETPIGAEMEVPIEGSIPIEGANATPTESMREPGIYKLDPVIETEQGAGPNEPDVDTGRRDMGQRWNNFQQGLRLRRDTIVVECPRCASQDKAA
jgi:uncharacterized protein YrrD